MVNEFLIADKLLFCHSSVKPFMLISIVVPYTTKIKNKCQCQQCILDFAFSWVHKLQIILKL